MLDPAMWGNLPEYAVFALPLAAIATLAVLLAARAGRRKKRTPSPARAPMSVAAPMVVKETAPLVTPTPSRAEIDRRIQAALDADHKQALAPLYLELARACHQQGDDAGRLTALRSAAGYGALHGPQAAHGSARLELAETAYLAGDLTSACEQWQLARTAFLAGGQTDQHERVQQRMRDNGCPTDWVLTDF